MTNGSDGDDERPSGDDAAPESSDDTVTSGAGDDADTSESPTDADESRDDVETETEENQTETGEDADATDPVEADDGDGTDDAGGTRPDDETDDEVPAREQAGDGNTAADAADTAAGDSDTAVDDGAATADGDTTADDDATADGDDDAGAPDPEPEAVLDPSATPPATGNGSAEAVNAPADEAEAVSATDEESEADSGSADEQSSSGFSKVPDEEWKDEGESEQAADGANVDGAPDRDAEAAADARMPDAASDESEDTTSDADAAAADAADADAAADGDSSDTDSDHESLDDPGPETDAPIAGEELVDKPPEDKRSHAPATEDGDAPLAGEVATTPNEGAPIGAEAGMEQVDDSGGLFGDDGPESDEEMPLTEHIEEMMQRLGAVFAVGGIVTLSVLLIGNISTTIPSAEEIIIFLWDAHVDFDNYRPYVYGPLELLLTKLKVAGLAGVIAALPVFVYQTYLFMRPGLYPHERRYYLAAIPTSLVLALVGVAFAHFLVLPAIFQYFISYTEVSANLAFGLRETFNLILLLMGYMAIVFQIPLFIQLAIMMGIVTREWMEERRLLFWGSFLGISFVVSPDPTGMSPIIVAATMVALFEGTLALLRWTGN
jgi:sec-independent protein translocase protein TatC